MELKPDGYVSFSGGMSSISPSLLGKNQYVYSVNQTIPKSGEGIQTRNGFRKVLITFQIDAHKKIWETGNPQGCGFYKLLNGEFVILYSISGYIFQLTGNDFIKTARIVNLDDQNDPLIKHCWITRVPNGAIVNNGFDAPLLVGEKETRRAKKSKREISPGLMGVYVQNRFWYVKPNRKEIDASTIKQPMSFDEAIVDNIFGVVSPEDESVITAIGKLGTIARDAAGGNLAFATEKDFYSADVRGPRATWGLAAQQGTGFVDNILPGIGAVSGNSFETSNGNIYFRNPIYGLVSLNQGRSDFQNKDRYTNHSIEASLFFDNDSKHFLDSCYTKAYDKSIYTTIAPQSNCDGFVYWNGLIIKTPDPYYGKQKEQYQDIVESVFTGLRPWDINVVGDVKQSMFILSYDYDCVNRLYLYDESLTRDLNNKGEYVDIESQLLTRSLDFAQPLFPKTPENKFYSLSDIRTNVSVEILSRTTDTEEFKSVSKLDFKTSNGCEANNIIVCDKCPESRDNISTGEDKTVRFFTVQNLIRIKGWCSLKRIISLAKVVDYDKTSTKTEDKPKEKKPCGATKIFSYKISK